jgi:DnaJ family protein C protein 10
VQKYDMYGEEGFESKSQHGRYQSWSYYHEDFGIYDDDPEIVTLDSADFQRSVLGTAWLSDQHDIFKKCSQ